ncbi:MAG: hypothetical protein NTV93_18665 [Verrucomicrobia bacterium]|nr:hypothetical protein [Verrucomicrobiota bacterium]
MKNNEGPWHEDFFEKAKLVVIIISVVFLLANTIATYCVKPFDIWQHPIHIYILLLGLYIYMCIRYPANPGACDTDTSTHPIYIAVAASNIIAGAVIVCLQDIEYWSKDGYLETRPRQFSEKCEIAVAIFIISLLLIIFIEWMAAVYNDIQTKKANAELLRSTKDILK